MTTAAAGLTPLGAEALAVRRIRVVGEALAGLAGLALVMVLIRRFADVPFPWWVFVIAVVLAALAAWWWAGVDHSHWAWRLTDELFEVRRGVLIRRSHLVPRSRIQNVTTTSGPLQRRYGVVTLTVHTAGARTRNVTIEDLDAGHAEGIRRRLGLV